MPPEEAHDEEPAPGLPPGWGRRVGLVILGLVAAGVLLAGVLIVVLRVVVDEAVGALELADLDDYEVRFTSCAPGTDGADGAVIAAGAFTNTADMPGSFELRLLAEVGDDTIGPTRVPVTGLAPGASVVFEATIASADRRVGPDDDVGCRAVVYDRSPG